MNGRRWSIEQALKPGLRHERDIENYDALCKSCHRKQDYNEEMSKHWSRGWEIRKARGLDLKRNEKGQFLTSFHGYR